MKLRLLAVLLVALTAPRGFATLTVCTSGCTHTDLQEAIDDANPGDEILLEEGRTFVGDFTLPVKGSGPAFTVIRTGVNASGVVQDTSRYTAANVRICPSGFSQDWFDCATRAPQDMSRIAKIKPATNNAYAIRTVNTGSGAAVSYYELRWLQFLPQSFAGNALIGITNETVPATTGNATQLPHHITLDRVVIGDPVNATRQFRGVQMDGNNLVVKNSLCWVAHEGEGQCLWANTSTGPIEISNTYCSGGAECFLTGGGGTALRPAFTVSASPSPTTTAFAVSGTTELYVGKQIAVHLHPFTVSSTTAANPTVVTTSSAHGLSTSQQVVITGTTGCTGVNDLPYTATVISSTTFSIPVNCGVAGSGGTGLVRASAEITSIVGSTLTVTPALPFAPASGDSVETSLVIRDLTVRHSIFTRPSAWRTSNPNDYLTKNTFELKQTLGATIEFNIIEHSWIDGQAGPCVVFTGTQQNADGDSAVNRNITFRYNVVRHCAMWLQITGTDALLHESARSGDFDLTNNLIYDIGDPWGVTSGMILGGNGGGPRQHPNRAPYDMTFEHNTVHYAATTPNNAILIDFCDPFEVAMESVAPNTLIRNNIFYAGSFGMVSFGTGSPNCGAGMSIGRLGNPPLGSGSSVHTNVLAGAESCDPYASTTTNMACPSVATLESGTFTNTTTYVGFAVKVTSPYYLAGTDGLSLGADIPVIVAGMVLTESGNVENAITRVPLRIRRRGGQ